MHKNDEHLIYQAVETAILNHVNDVVKEKLNHPTVQTLISNAIEDCFNESNLTEMVKDHLEYNDEVREMLSSVIYQYASKVVMDKFEDK